MTTLTPARWRRSFGNLRSNLADTFENWMPRPTERFEGWPEQGFTPAQMWWGDVPAVEVSEDDKALHVTAELPGMNKDDFDVELTGNHLIIKGEKRSNREKREGGYYYSECSYGSFSRSIPLPAEVEEDKVSADYKQGVLHITLPKSEKAQGHRIPITST